MSKKIILFWRVENSHGFAKDFKTKDGATAFAALLSSVTDCRYFPVYAMPDYLAAEIERLNKEREQ
jgi:hypothetical protein